MIHVTQNDGAHPYFDHWWKPGHIIGYQHTFVNELADICFALGSQPPIVPLPDFADANQTQRVLAVAITAARHRAPVSLSEVT